MPAAKKPAKKPAARKRSAAKPKKKEIEEVIEERIERTEPRRKEDGPIASALAIGIVALIVGSALGGWLAFRIAESDEYVEEVVVVEEVVEEPEVIEEPEVVLDPLVERAGVVISGDEDDDLFLYNNDYYGFQFEFPSEWDAEERVIIAGPETTLVYISNDVSGDAYGGVGDIRSTVKVIELDGRSFEDATDNLEINDERMTDKLEVLRRAYTIPEDAPTADDVEYESQRLRIDGHDVLMNLEQWTVPGYIEGPAYTYREYWIELDMSNVLYIRLASPTGEDVDETLEPAREMVGSLEFYNPIRARLDS